MATLRLGPVIGQLGGGEVVIEPFSVHWTGSGDTQEDRPIHTVDGLPEEKFLVTTFGDFLGPPSGQGSQPEIMFGDFRQVLSRDSNGKVLGHAAVCRGGDTVTMRKNGYASSEVYYIGDVFVVPLPQ